MVEPNRAIPFMTTHPTMIIAASEVFRGWGAEVRVGEAPGHVRDTEMAFIESGVGAALSDADLPFADLNYEQVGWRRNRGRISPLRGIYLSQNVLEADYVVSMPKMKTHHWVGITCSMKNFYGVLPGIKYGWPKNVLHHNGIPQTVVDINATLGNTLAIIDGIDCMEGDGPILGRSKPSRRRRHRGPHHGLAAGADQLPPTGRKPSRPNRRKPHHPTGRAMARTREFVSSARPTRPQELESNSRRAIGKLSEESDSGREP